MAGSVRCPSITMPRRSRSRSRASGTPSTSASYGAIELVARMRHALGEIAVVGQDDQALGVEVEAADRIEVAADTGARDQVDDGRAPLRIRSGADDAAGLVQEQVAATGRGLQAASVDLDLVRARDPPSCRARSTTLSVDGDAALLISSSAARREATPVCESSLLRRIRRSRSALALCPQVALARSGSNGSGDCGAGSPTDAGRSNPSSSDMSSTFGRSEKSFSPNRSRNSRVVP